MAQVPIRVAAISARVPSRLRSLHAEFSRRRLYAAATAYGVGAAGIIQLTAVVAPLLGLPSTTATLVLYVSLAGFPVVLALAWFIDLTWEKDEEDVGTAAVPAAAAAPALPGDATEFVGRAAELAEVRRLLAAPGCRLLTVTGPGGIGKTRLALKAAVSEWERFRDGARFAGLANLEEPELLAAELAAALGVEGAGGEQPQARLLEFLREKQILVMVDGVEDVAAAAGALLATLLERVPGLTVIATSRERLGVPAETVFPLEGLALPRAGDAEALEGSDAARLFMAGARRARPGWEPAEEDLPHLARVCRLTEGSPLALELASAWVRLLSCAEIAAEIQRDRDFLAGASGGFPERHRSLRSVFDSSWRLLPEPERQVLRRVSVFSGGFTREAAAAVAGAGLPLLASLHARSLVRRTPAGRFDVAEALRGYAEEKLGEDPAERVETETRHRAFYAGALRALARVRGHAGAELRAVADDLDNVRRAWEGMVEARAAAELEGALEGLYLFYAARGRAREGEAAFAAAEGALAGEEEHAGVLASLRTRRGTFQARLGAYAPARALLEAAIAHFRAAGPAPELAFALSELGVVAHSRGGYDEARGLHQEALDVYRAAGDGAGAARALTRLGNVAYALGDHADAERLYREGLAGLREAGDPGATYSPLCNLGVVASLRGDFAAAERFYAQALAVAREADNPRGAANVLLNLGVAATDAGDPVRGEPQLAECAAISREMGYDRLLAFALNGLAHAAVAREDDAAAQAHAREALATATRIGETPVELEVLTVAARLHLRAGRGARALELAALVRRHPAADSQAREAAERVTAEAEAALSPEEREAAESHGAALTLEEAVGEAFSVEGDPAPAAAG